MPDTETVPVPQPPPPPPPPPKPRDPEEGGRKTSVYDTARGTEDRPEPAE